VTGAEELMEMAAQLAPAGDFDAAADALERAAALHAEAGRGYDHARCLQLAATLHRTAGRPERAAALIADAAAIEVQDDTLRVSILAEAAETAAATGDLDEALRAYNGALSHACLSAEGRNALLRRRAAALLALGRVEEAERDYDAAHALLDAGHVRIEQARALIAHDRTQDAARVLAALEPKDLHARAEQRALEATLARAAGDHATAEAKARQARDDALSAVAPVAYLAAALELNEALAAQHRHADAYGTLADALVTLGDAIGEPAAREWIEPALIARRNDWGPDGFAAARAEHERRRRAAKEAT
jgi:tetratricopeptide (TPR) repeat protein